MNSVLLAKTAVFFNLQLVLLKTFIFGGIIVTPLAFSAA